MDTTIKYNQPTPVKGDSILQLPVDQTPPLPNEVHIIDTLFKKHRRTMDVLFEEAKDAIIVSLLVILASMPQFDLMIYKILPITQKSPYFLLLAKGLITGFVYWLFKHFYLSRKT